jgi:DNA polymerase-1
MAVAFDGKKPYHKQNIFPAYKSDRPEKDADLDRQIDLGKRLLMTTGLDVYCVDGVEADDIMASYCAQVSNVDGVVIFSADKDCNQILEKGRVTIAKHVTVNGIGAERNICPVWYTEHDLWDEFGVKPSQWVDFLALCGDRSDGIPGVEWVGQVNARKLLQVWGSLDNAMQNLASIGLGARVADSLRKHADFIPVARELITLKKDVQLQSIAARSDEVFMKLYHNAGLEGRGDVAAVLKFRGA